MKSQLSKQISIAKRIIDGAVTIDSLQEFESMLQIFPNDPELHRAYADLLVHKKSYELATKIYRKTAELFITAGKLLPAILCKNIEWRIHKPSYQQAMQFYDALHKGSYHETSVNIFFSRLSYPELVALMNRMERVRLPAGQAIKKIGDAEESIYFVVSGNLTSTTYRSLTKNGTDHRKATVYLSENDFFGRIYPFEEEKRSQSYTDTVSRVELIKIPKPRLRQVSKKYPNIELGIIDLVKVRSAADENGILRSVRKTERHQLPLRMNLRIYPDPLSYHPVVLDGCSKDVSVGGICIVLDAKYTNIPAVYKGIKNARIEISLPAEALTINVMGAIVWSKPIYFEGEKTVALGIRFEEMSPKLGGMLVVFADILSTGSRPVVV
jgi:CRP-like cAMP-binding protein